MVVGLVGFTEHLGFAAQRAVGRCVTRSIPPTVTQLGHRSDNGRAVDPAAIRACRGCAFYRREGDGRQSAA